MIKIYIHHLDLTLYLLGYKCGKFIFCESVLLFICVNIDAARSANHECDISLKWKPSQVLKYYCFLFHSWFFWQFCYVEIPCLIAGFRELAEDDQIRLIKQGSFEVMLVRYTVLFQEDQMFVPSMTFKVSRSVIYSLFILSLVAVWLSMGGWDSWLASAFCDWLVRIYYQTSNVSYT